ncbi:MAG: Ig-like domain-containing protein [Leptospiraceae bacterium]
MYKKKLPGIMIPGGLLLPVVFALMFLPGACSEKDVATSMLPGFQESPRVLASYPPDGMEGLDSNKGIWVLFDQPMDRTRTERAFGLTGSAGQVPGAFRWDAPGKLEFFPARSLDGRKYLLRVGTKAESRAGLDLQQEYRAQFSTSVDSEGPELLDSVPSDGQQGVSKEVNIQLSFSEPISLEGLNDGLNLNPSMRYQLDLQDQGREIIIQPASHLIVGQRYTVSLNESIVDVSGNPLKSPTRISFLVGSDHNAPDISSVQVGEEDLSEGTVTANVSKYGPIRISFSEPVDPLAAEDGIRLSPEAEMDISWDESNSILSLNPQPSLSGESYYELSISEEVKDLAGNPLNNPGLFFFLTNARDSTAPRVSMIQQGKVSMPGGIDGAEPVTEYFPDPELPDYGIVDTAQLADTDNGEAGMRAALVFRILFTEDMQLTSLYEAIRFIPVIDTGGSELEVHSVSRGAEKNEAIVLASWTPAAGASPVYALEISTRALDSDGNALPERFRRYLSL